MTWSATPQITARVLRLSAGVSLLEMCLPHGNLYTIIGLTHVICSPPEDVCIVVRGWVPLHAGVSELGLNRESRDTYWWNNVCMRVHDQATGAVRTDVPEEHCEYQISISSGLTE